MLSLPAELTHVQAKSCLQQLTVGLAAETASSVVVDATALGRFDSSALAVLLELRRSSLRAGKTLAVQGLPSKLSDLAALYGIEELLTST